MTLEFLDGSGKAVNKFSSKEAPRPQAGPADEEENPFRGAPPARLTAQAGMNIRLEPALSGRDHLPRFDYVGGQRHGAARIARQVQRAAHGGWQGADAELRGEEDPRLETTPEEYAKQLSLSLQVRDKLSDTNGAVIRIRELRKQLDEYTKRDSKKVADAAKALNQKLTEVEEALYQTKNRASEDPLNYPIKLNNKLAHVLGVVQSSDNQPTQQSYMVYEDLATQVNAELKKLDVLMGADLVAFNKLIRDENVPAVQAPPKKSVQ